MSIDLGAPSEPLIYSLQVRTHQTRVQHFFYNASTTIQELQEWIAMFFVETSAQHLVAVHPWWRCYRKESLNLEPKDRVFDYLKRMKEVEVQVKVEQWGDDGVLERS